MCTCHNYHPSASKKRGHERADSSTTNTRFLERIDPLFLSTAITALVLERIESPLFRLTAITTIVLILRIDDDRSIPADRTGITVNDAKEGKKHKKKSKLEDRVDNM
jgi:hypothetical protein